jgi:hypothetical protein
MKIKVGIRKMAGHTWMYPQCETSRLLAKLLKQKSFTQDDVELLKLIGFKIEVVNRGAA